VAWKKPRQRFAESQGTVSDHLSRAETIDKAVKVCRTAGSLRLFPGYPTAPPAALIVPAEASRSSTPILRCTSKGFRSVAGSTRGSMDPEFDFTTFPEVVKGRAVMPTARRGIDNPSTQFVACRGPRLFSPQPRSSSWRISASPRPATGGKGRPRWGTSMRNGRLPINPDGGLKSFGHPVGASGLRMLYEAWPAVPRRRR